jgi:zinc protease
MRGISSTYLRSAITTGLLLVFSRVAHADAPPSGPFGNVVERRLANGMEVVVQEDHRVPLVSLVLRYDVGERAAPAGLSGIASLTTSLMLRATQHVRAGEYYRLLARAGALYSSDSTATDATFLQVEVPSNQFELPLWLWSDQMGFFARGLDDAQVDAQRSALEAKRRAWLDGETLARVPLFAQEELLPTDHPYRNAIAGPPEALHGIDREAILAFHDAWMTPDHATLAVVGDVAPSEAFSLVEKYFGSIARPEPSRAIARPPPVTLLGETQVDVAANVPAARILIRWPSARYLTTDDAHLDILGRVLNGGRTSWLYWSLVDEKKVARRIWVNQYSLDLGSQFEVTIEGAAGRSPADLLAAFDATMQQLEQRQASAGVISMAAYETVIGKLVDIESARRRAQSFATYAALVGTPGYYAHDFDRYDHVPVDAIHDAIVRWMPRDRRVVVLVTPDRKAPVSGMRTGRRFVPAGGP